MDSSSIIAFDRDILELYCAEKYGTPEPAPMHRVEDNGLNFNFEYKKDVVTEEEMEYLYYYLCRVLFRGIEDKERTVGEILEMI